MKIDFLERRERIIDRNFRRHLTIKNKVSQQTINRTLFGCVIILFLIAILAWIFCHDKRVYPINMTVQSGLTISNLYGVPHKPLKEAGLVNPPPPAASKKVKKVVKKPKPVSIKDYAYKRVKETWGVKEWESFDKLVYRESGWRQYAVNPSSGACGLFQALPCKKVGSLEATNQINWGINYILQRYGSPSRALAFHYKNNWY